jgi:LmbE family N-acetylglucosaminyl deacetylase
MGRRVLVLSPHTDDAEFGCGGTIASHVLNGDTVKWLTFVRDGYQVPEGWDKDTLVKECEQAMIEIGVTDHIMLDFELENLEQDQRRVTDIVYKTVHNFNPHFIYTPFRNCRHQDHAAVYIATSRAAWKHDSMILGYKLPNDLANFSPTVFVPLKKHAVKVKERAVMSYKSQFELRKWLTMKLIDAQNSDFSAFVDCPHVEPFELIRWVMR